MKITDIKIVIPEETRIKLEMMRMAAKDAAFRRKWPSIVEIVRNSSDELITEEDTTYLSGNPKIEVFYWNLANVDKHSFFIKTLPGKTVTLFGFTNPDDAIHFKLRWYRPPRMTTG